MTVSLTQRFSIYLGLESFSLGISYCTLHHHPIWKKSICLNLGFISLEFYFKNKLYRSKKPPSSFDNMLTTTH